MGYRKLLVERDWVEYLDGGPDNAPDLLLFHIGSPGAAVLYPGLVRAAATHGIRVAAYSRGGYGASPRREGRSVAGEAPIAAALADRLGYERFFTLGWSGGGPVTLATAALLPDRVRACMAIASLAPPTESGEAWRTFWSPEQLQDWDELASGDLAALIPDFEEAVPAFSSMTVARLSRAEPEDPRALAHDIRAEVLPTLVKAMRRAVSRGYVGYLDDNLAQARDWGFRVADIRVPVVIRHGELDKLVPVAHGRWLANAIPGARSVFPADAGHGSVALPWTETVAQLVDAVD